MVSAAPERVQGATRAGGLAHLLDWASSVTAKACSAAKRLWARLAERWTSESIGGSESAMTQSG